MYSFQWNDSRLRSLTTDGLCSILEEDFHAPVLQSLEVIGGQISDAASLTGLAETATGLVVLLFSKLSDELRHNFLKESGIVYPCIRNNCAVEKKSCHAPCLEQTLLDSIQQRHQVVIGLTQKIRQLLNNYMPEKSWSLSLHKVANEFFLLENKVLQWIHIEQNYLFPQVRQICNSRSVSK